MNAFEQFLASILNPGGRFSAGGMNRLASAGSLPPGATELGMPATPEQVAAAGPFPAASPMPQEGTASAFAPVQAPQPAPMPQRASAAPSGGGVGDFFANMFDGGASRDRNQTVEWLVQHGESPARAQLIVRDPATLQQYLLQKTQGSQPEYDFMNVDGTLVRMDKRSGTIAPMGQFGSPDDDLPASYQEYQLAKKDGFEGSYTDWKTMGVRDQNADFGRYQDVRKEIQQLPSYKNFAQAAPIYDTMVDALSRDTKAADLNLVYGLGKIFDPNSVVREGEMVLVKDTASLPDWLVGSINSVNGGARLQADTRNAILAEAQSRINAYKTMIDSDMTQYQELAKQFKLDPAFIIPPLPKLRELPNNPAARLPPPPAAVAPVAPTMPPPQGVVKPSGGVIDWKDFIAPGRRQ